MSAHTCIKRLLKQYYCYGRNFISSKSFRSPKCVLSRWKNFYANSMIRLFFWNFRNFNCLKLRCYIPGLCNPLLVLKILHRLRWSYNYAKCERMEKNSRQSIFQKTQRQKTMVQYLWKWRKSQHMRLVLKA